MQTSATAKQMSFAENIPVSGVLLLLMLSFLWGGNFIVGKTLVDHASPITLTILRWAIAIICLIQIGRAHV